VSLVKFAQALESNQEDNRDQVLPTSRLISTSSLGRGLDFLSKTELQKAHEPQFGPFKKNRENFPGN
jgi:hypothetical protein